MLYTDGIIERPGRAPHQATVELSRVGADSAAGRIRPEDRGQPVSATPQRVCRQTLELLTRATGHRDDITLLAAQPHPPVKALAGSIGAAPDDLTLLRAAVTTWFAELGVDAGATVALQHALGEVMTNAVEHAQPDSVDPAHQVTVNGRLSPDGALELRVADQGQWRTPRDTPHRGMGLKVAERFVDRMEFDRTEHGTTVVLIRAVERPVILLAGGASFGTGDASVDVDAEPFVAELTGTVPTAFSSSAARSTPWRRRFSATG